MALEEAQAAALAGRAEDLLAAVEGLADPAAREAAIELVRALLELYGEGLARLTGIALAAGDDAIRGEIAGDALVSHLLSLHGLHPVDPGDRARQAIETARPGLGGAEPELVSIEGGVATLRLPAAGGCRSSADAVRTTLAEAVRSAVPELERVEIDQPSGSPVIPLESVRSRT